MRVQSPSSKMLYLLVMLFPTSVKMNLLTKLLGRQVLNWHYHVIPWNVLKTYCRFHPQSPVDTSRYYDYSPGYDNYYRRQYVPPRQETTTPGSVFNFDQKSSFDVSNSGYLMTLLLLGNDQRICFLFLFMISISGTLGAATFGILAFGSASTTNRRKRNVDNFTMDNFIHILENLDERQTIGQ